VYAGGRDGATGADEAGASDNNPMAADLKHVRTQLRMAPVEFGHRQPACDFGLMGTLTKNGVRTLACRQPVFDAERDAGVDVIRVFGVAGDDLPGQMSEDPVREETESRRHSNDERPVIP